MNSAPLSWSQLLQVFDFSLPEELIATYPANQRTEARLLLVNQKPLRDIAVSQLGSQLRAGDVLVLNDAQVIKARLHTQRASGGKVEVLFHRLLSAHRALVQCSRRKRLQVGERLQLQASSDSLEVIAPHGRWMELASTVPWPVLLEQHGQLPLPPYMKRAAEAVDQQRYQTVYARHPGAVAAPTAGLHFDWPLLQQLQQQGVELVFVSLEVGAGTFAPLEPEQWQHGTLHEESFEISDIAADRIELAVAQQRRVIAVGTTSLRALESAWHDGHVRRGLQSTRLFIRPGFGFAVVNGLMTNFHLPRSSLFMLVCAFGGIDTLHQAYRWAIAQQLRFYSYGDASLIWRKTEPQQPLLLNV